MKCLGFLTLVIIFLSGCSSSTNQLPYSTGSSREITVVVKSEDWINKTRLALENIFCDTLEALPRPERNFDLLMVQEKLFNRLYQKNGNVLLFSIDDSVTNNQVLVHKNKWSRGQLVINVHSSSLHGALNELSKQGDSFKNLFLEAAIDRDQQYFRSAGTGLDTFIVNQHKVSGFLKPGAILAKNEIDFFWYKWESEMMKGGFEHQVSQNLLVYYEPYTDASQLSLNYLLSRRDSVLKRHVPGNSEGSYLSTSYRLFRPFEEEVLLNGEYAKVIQGLWRAEGGMNMGGPFLALHKIDTIRNRLLSIEGFVYAPQFEKREFLQQLEAVAKGIEVSVTN